MFEPNGHAERVSAPEDSAHSLNEDTGIHSINILHFRIAVYRVVL